MLDTTQKLSRIPQKDVPVPGASNIYELFARLHDPDFLGKSADNILSNLPPAPGPADFSEIAEQQGIIDKVPSREELLAKIHRMVAQAHQKTFAEVQGIQTPAPPTIDQPQVSPLELPNAPQRRSYIPEPISQIGAAIAGLFSRRRAAQFAAAALQGAKQGQDQEYADRQRQFQEEVAKRSALHADEMRRAEVKARIDADNKRLVYEHDIATSQAKMKATVEAGRQSELKAQAEGEEEGAKALRPAQVALSRIQAKKEQMRQTEAARAKGIDAATKLLSLKAQLEEKKTEAATRAATAKDAQELRKWVEIHEDIRKREFDNATTAIRREGLDIRREGIAASRANAQAHASTMMAIASMNNAFRVQLETMKEKSASGLFDKKQAFQIGKVFLGTADAEVKRAETAMTAFEKANPWPVRKKNVGLQRAWAMHNDAIIAAKSHKTEMEATLRSNGMHPDGVGGNDNPLGLSR